MTTVAEITLNAQLGQKSVISEPVRHIWAQN